MEVPAEVEGRSVLIAPTQILLQLDSLAPTEYVGLRVFVSVPTKRYAHFAEDQITLKLQSDSRVLELQEYSLATLTEGLLDSSLPK